MTMYRSRREFLSRAWNGIGAFALADLLASESSGQTAPMQPLAPKQQHFARKAKRCIFVFMAGGVSQVDTFEYKPKLKEYVDKRLPRLPGLSGEIEGFLGAPHRVIPSPFEVQQDVESGRAPS